MKMVSMAINNQFSNQLRNKLMNARIESNEVITRSELQRLRQLTFGEPQEVDLADSDKILKSVADWTTFEESVILSKEMRFPSVQITDQLNATDWKNIPIPLKEALNVIKTSLISSEKLLVFLCRESRYKCENLTLALKNITGQHKERDRMTMVKINNNHKDALF